MNFAELINELLKGFLNFTWGNALMILVGGVLIALAVIKEYEPVLLLPIGFGCILANIPLTGMSEGNGLFAVLYKAGISTELFPLLIFIGVGAMIDFSPSAFPAEIGLAGCCRPVWDFRNAYPGYFVRLSNQRSGFNRCDWGYRWPNIHFRCYQAGAEPACSNCCGSLLIHEPGSNYSASFDEAC